jgi:antitoxin VapB
LEAEMAILIKDPETDRIVRELAARTGETITEAVRKAAQERAKSLPALQRERVNRTQLAALLAEIQTYPVSDNRTPDEIVGYDNSGLPR